MFYIITLIAIAVIVLAGYFTYRVKITPDRKREQASEIINKESPFKTKMEMAREEGIDGGDNMREITFTPLDFPDEENAEVFLLPKNPYQIFCYWNITENTVKVFEREHGSGSWDASQPVLIVTDHSDNITYEVMINDFADNWYLKVNKPSHLFSTILARRFPCGKTVVLAHSNKVQTQPDGISPIIDKDWLPIGEIWKEEKEKVSIGLSSW